MAKKLKFDFTALHLERYAEKADADAPAERPHAAGLLGSSQAIAVAFIGVFALLDVRTSY